jgi:diguanylate cyclase
LKNRTAGTTHWIVRLNHRVRSAVFLAVFVLIASHLMHQPHGWLPWTLLATQFLLYPHLIYLAAARARDPMRAEMKALVLDPLLMGLWLSWLGFPLWIGFAVAIGTLISISVYRGWRGSIEAGLALVLGAFVGMATFGVRFEPETAGWTTALSMAALGLYLLLVAHGAHARGLQLRAAREQLRANELALRDQLAEISGLQSKLHDQANRDALTGLYNRRYLADALGRELARCKRDGQPLILLMIDIDHFKQINDTHGHHAGDEVLREIATLLTRNTRPSDIVCRYGGEEFLVLLPNMTLPTGHARAQAYRAHWEATTVTADTAPVRTTLSIGLAAFPQHAQTAHELIQRADSALYQAKRGGRNRVVEATDE